MSKAKVILGLLEYKLLKLTGASKLFDDEWYIHEYPHLKNWNEERLLHYIYHGKNEGLRPNPLICPKWTKDQQYGRILKKLRVNPLWIVSLLGNWISPHPVLSTRNKAIEKNYSSPLKSGRESTDLIYRGRGIINLFDQEWYINNYNCYYKGKKVGPLYHFLVSGWKTGFDPSPLISIGYINMVSDDSDDSDGLDPLSNYIISITKKQGNKPGDHGLVIHKIDNVVERIKKIYVNTPSLSELNEALQKINLIDDAEKRRIAFTVRDNKAEEEFLSFLDRKNYDQNIISEDISTTKKEIEKNSWYKTIYNAFKVIGVSVVIEEDGNCFDHELYSCMRRKNIDLKGIIKCTDKTALIEYKHDNRRNNIIEKGIDLTGYADNNYFHFMVDIAPKVIMSNILINEREIPFVVNNSMPSAFVDIIRILDEKSRGIVWLDNENGYKFRKLICLPKTYRLYNMYTSKYKGSEPIMPITMLNIIRKNIYEYVGEEQSEHKLLKIYVKRKGGRNIINSRKIEKLLFEEGFIFISPEDYDMEMQVRLFRRASHVVAATGAALTNLLWVKTNSKILVMLSDNKLHQPSIWEDFAKISSSEITLLYGEREFANDDYGGIHDNFHIDLKKVTEWLSINQAAE